MFLFLLKMSTEGKILFENINKKRKSIKQEVNPKIGTFNVINEESKDQINRTTQIDSHYHKRNDILNSKVKGDKSKISLDWYDTKKLKELYELIFDKKPNVGAKKNDIIDEIMNFFETYRPKEVSRIQINTSLEQTSEPFYSRYREDEDEDE
jgi:hypothetical protein